jgi:hypothetical protein
MDDRIREKCGPFIARQGPIQPCQSSPPSPSRICAYIALHLHEKKNSLYYDNQWLSGEMDGNWSGFPPRPCLTREGKCRRRGLNSMRERGFTILELFSFLSVMTLSSLSSSRDSLMALILSSDRGKLGPLDWNWTFLTLGPFVAGDESPLSGGHLLFLRG